MNSSTTCTGSQLTKREINTILAALRHYQHHHVIGHAFPDPEHGVDIEAIARDGGLVPLDEAEIDDLCELLSCG